MRQFREFKSEQQYVTEIGPIAATLAGVAGLVGGAMAAKKLVGKFKSYKKSKAERKQNSSTGLVVDIKKFNPKTGETDTVKQVVKGKDADVDNEGALKLQKKMQSQQDVENSRLEVDYVEKGGEKPKDEPKQDEPETEVSPEQELRSKGDKDPKDGGINDDGEANKYKKLTGKAPRGWRTFTYKSGASELRMNKEDRVLKFGEFIQEDVVSDLKKISKSKKDMEIKLSDGSEIPIDPMTADIFVKYIEGLKSSEQKRVINQIQRTERGFMKVLGKAHGE